MKSYMDGHPVDGIINYNKDKHSGLICGYQSKVGDVMNKGDNDEIMIKKLKDNFSIKNVVSMKSSMHDIGYNMIKNYLKSNGLEISENEMKEIVEKFFVNLSAMFGGLSQLHKMSLKDILSMAWKNKAYFAMMVGVGIAGGVIGTMAAPVLLGALGFSTAVGTTIGATVGGILGGAMRFFGVKALSKEQSKIGGMDMSNIESSIKDEMFKSDNIKMILSKTVNEHMVSKLPKELIEKTERKNILDSVKIYFENTDENFNKLNENEKQLKIARYATLINVYKNRNLSAIKGAKSKDMLDLATQVSVSGGIAGALFASPNMSLLVSLGASSIYGVINAVKTLDKAYLTKVINEIKNIDIKKIDESSIKALEELLDNEKIIANSAVHTVLQSKVYDYYESKNHIVNENVKSNIAFKNKLEKLSNMEKAKHVLNKTLISMAIGTVSAITAGAFRAEISDIRSHGLESGIKNIGNNMMNGVVYTGTLGNKTFDGVNINSLTHEQLNIEASKIGIYTVDKSGKLLSIEDLRHAVSVKTGGVINQSNLDQVKLAESMSYKGDTKNPLDIANGIMQNIKNGNMKYVEDATINDWVSDKKGDCNRFVSTFMDSYIASGGKKNDVTLLYQNNAGQVDHVMVKIGDKVYDPSLGKIIDDIDMQNISQYTGDKAFDMMKSINSKDFFANALGIDDWKVRGRNTVTMNVNLFGEREIHLDNDFTIRKPAGMWVDKSSKVINYPEKFEQFIRSQKSLAGKIPMNTHVVLTVVDENNNSIKVHVGDTNGMEYNKNLSISKQNLKNLMIPNIGNEINNRNINSNVNTSSFSYKDWHRSPVNLEEYHLVNDKGIFEGRHEIINLNNSEDTILKGLLVNKSGEFFNEIRKLGGIKKDTLISVDMDKIVALEDNKLAVRVNVEGDGVKEFIIDKGIFNDQMYAGKSALNPIENSDIKKLNEEIDLLNDELKKLNTEIENNKYRYEAERERDEQDRILYEENQNQEIELLKQQNNNKSPVLPQSKNNTQNSNTVPNPVTPHVYDDKSGLLPEVSNLYLDFLNRLKNIGTGTFDMVFDNQSRGLNTIGKNIDWKVILAVVAGAHRYLNSRYLYTDPKKWKEDVYTMKDSKFMYKNTRRIFDATIAGLTFGLHTGLDNFNWYRRFGIPIVINSTENLNRREDRLAFDNNHRWNINELHHWTKVTHKLLGTSATPPIKAESDMFIGDSFSIRTKEGSVHRFKYIGIDPGSLERKYIHTANIVTDDLHYIDRKRGEEVTITQIDIVIGGELKYINSIGDRKVINISEMKEDKKGKDLKDKLDNLKIIIGGQIHHPIPPVNDWKTSRATLDTMRKGLDLAKKLRTTTSALTEADTELDKLFKNIDDGILVGEYKIRGNNIFIDPILTNIFTTYLPGGPPAVFLVPMLTADLNDANNFRTELSNLLVDIGRIHLDPSIGAHIVTELNTLRTQVNDRIDHIDDIIARHNALVAGLLGVISTAINTAPVATVPPWMKTLIISEIQSSRILPLLTPFRTTIVPNWDINFPGHAGIDVIPLLQVLGNISGLSYSDNQIAQILNNIGCTLVGGMTITDADVAVNF